MPKATILRGLPASGKSTEAKRLVEASGETVRVNKDLLRTMLHFDKFTGKREDLTHLVAKAVANLALSQGYNVVIDDTNLNPRTLEGWKTNFRDQKTHFEVVNIETPIEECIQRDRVREKRVGDHVITKMAMQYLEHLKDEKIVICDIDGTIADCTHREHHLAKTPKDWGSFFGEQDKDPLRMEVAVQVAKACEEHNAKLIFVSARPETYREVTEKWLEDHFHIGDIVLIMRGADDKRDDDIVKREIYEKYFKHTNVVKVFDDRPRVIRVWRSLGLDVVDVGTRGEF